MLLPKSITGIDHLGRLLYNEQLSEYSLSHRKVIEHEIDEFIAILDRELRGKKYFAITDTILKQFNVSSNKISITASKYNSILIARLLSLASARSLARYIPQDILDDYCLQFYRIAQNIATNVTDYMKFGNDVFIKDLGLCRLEVFPCISLLVEKYSGVPRRLIGKGGVSQVIRFISLSISLKARYYPFFEIHAHTPMMANFTPEGWDRCYQLVAQLLHRYPDYLGLVGSSWFFDPKIKSISPHLSYLRERALEGGATFFRSGSSTQDILNATAKSRRRRELYEAGEYTPTSHFMVWPRKCLIEWAEKHAVTQETSR